jgi:hypothetical protein
VDILAGFGELSKKPADLGSSPSESVIFLPNCHAMIDGEKILSVVWYLLDIHIYLLGYIVIQVPNNGDYLWENLKLPSCS